MSIQVPPIPTFPRFPGNENPYLAWTTFSRAIIDTFSRAPVISQHGKGLLGPLLTPAEYASLPGVPVVEAYTTPYTHPGDDPPAAATAFSLWQWQMARYAQHQGAINIYTHTLLSMCQSEVKQDLERLDFLC
jgi:hypothetical protein